MAKEEAERLKKKATLIVASIRESNSQTDKKGKQGPRPVGRRTNLKQDQCAHFKESGHWKNECPNRQKGKAGVIQPTQPLLAGTT